MTFDHHISNVSRSCYHHLRALRHIRASLPDDVARTVACSIVSSRTDYCNSLYYGVSVTNLQMLQRVQNDAARVILGLQKFDHITCGLLQFALVTRKYRINYKTASLTFKIIHTRQPKYLSDIIRVYEPPRVLRWASHLFLSAYKSNTVISFRAFKHCSREIWNWLPVSLRDGDCFSAFRSGLKTHFFKNWFWCRLVTLIHAHE